MKLKLAPKKNSRYTRSNPDPHSPAAFENTNLIPRNLSKQKQEDFIGSSPKTVQPTYFSTPVKVLFHSTPTSPFSSSTSPSTVSTPPFTTHTTTPIIPAVLVVPFIPVAPLIPVNMANRYAPL